ncbi:DgyrCDS2199 [Dimorphilus gyrociliatus]|nr:DgyrCDS2199 [Dimorphilus gyrociliatus]
MISHLLRKMRGSIKRKIQSGYRHHYVSQCITGCLGCRWKRYRQSRHATRWEHILWIIYFLVTLAFIVFWFLYWIAIKNDSNNINWYVFEKLHKWLDVYRLVLALTGTTFAYLLLIAILLISHLILGYQLYIHILHRGVFTLIIIMCVIFVILLSKIYKEGYPLLNQSMMAMAPFVWMLVVVFLTGCSWLVGNKYVTLQEKVHKAALVTIYAIIMLFCYLFAIGIESPCFTSQISAKPRFVAHRGASAIGPENTIYSFNKALEHGAFVLESDVVQTADGELILLHDKTFRRTTNIKDIEGGKFKNTEPCALNYSFIETLDAGSWFLEQDPFRTKSSLTDVEKAEIRKQKIPRLSDLVDLATKANVSILFDLNRSTACDGKNATSEETKMRDIHFNDQAREIIENSKLPKRNVWWLESAKTSKPIEFTLVGEGKSGYQTVEELKEKKIDLVNYQHIVSRYGEDLKAYKYNNISTNVYVVDASWLFSVCWCAGIESVTTNEIQNLSKLASPDWRMSKLVWRILIAIFTVLSASFATLVIVCSA